MLTRRDLIRGAGIGLLASAAPWPAQARQTPSRSERLTITGLKITPIALPDPPLLAASGCHGPYFLRTIVELETDGGIVGLGEVPGGQGTVAALEKARSTVMRGNAFAYRQYAHELMGLGMAVYAAIEMACLDAAGKATGRRVCELLGGPVRDPVDFAAYLFYRYAADHPTILADPRIVDARGRGDRALDDWGEVRSPDAMARMAAQFRERFGFSVFKLKGGVLAPDAELETMRALAATLGPKCSLRIDPNARWTVPTALRIGHRLHDVPLEYYEDPVAGQAAMAAVRKETGLKMSTNMCVTRFADLPDAFRLKPIDVLLLDHHYFGGFAGCQALEPMSAAAGWTLSQHSNSHTGITMAAMIHLAASIPRLTLASDTHYPWLPESADILEGPKLAIRDGRMSVPAGPGFGVALDLDKLGRAHEAYNKSGMRRRDDGALMRKLEPGWDGRPL